MCVSELGATKATSTLGSFTLGGSSYGLDKVMPNCLGRCYTRSIQTKLESVRVNKPCETGLEHRSMHQSLCCTKAFATSNRITVNRDCHWQYVRSGLPLGGVR